VLPEPDGPTRPIASPRPILRSMSFRMWTRAAAWPSERLTPESAMAGSAVTVDAVEMSFMGLRSYGKATLQVQRLSAAIVVGVFALSGLGGWAVAAERTVKLVAFGDSLMAGYQLAAAAAFPAQLDRALKSKGLAV